MHQKVSAANLSTVLYKIFVEFNFSFANMSPCAFSMSFNFVSAKNRCCFFYKRAIGTLFHPIIFLTIAIVAHLLYRHGTKNLRAAPLQAKCINFYVNMFTGCGKVFIGNQRCSCARARNVCMHFDETFACFR